MTLSLERKQSLATKALTYARHLDSDERALSYLVSRGISREVAQMFSLGSVPAGDTYAGWISIPYTVPTGVVDIKFRALEEDAKPKYQKEPGCGVHLYNAPVLKAAHAVVLVEGEFKAMAVQAYAGLPAVGFPGTDTWRNQKHWPLCLEGVGRVYVLADPDPQGRKAAQYVADSIGWSARVIDLGEQADNYLVRHGRDAFLKELNR